jgi:hypothetical protein
MHAHEGFSLLVIVTIIALSMAGITSLWRQQSYVYALAHDRALCEQRTCTTQLLVVIVQEWLALYEKQVIQTEPVNLVVRPLSCADNNTHWGSVELKRLKESIIFTAQLHEAEDAVCSLSGELRKQNNRWVLMRRRLE